MNLAKMDLKNVVFTFIWINDCYMMCDNLGESWEDARLLCHAISES